MTFDTDSLERIFWTVVQAVVATLIVEIADWSYAWAPILMAALVTLKTWVAKRIGPPDAALLPSSLRSGVDG